MSLTMLDIRNDDISIATGKRPEQSECTSVHDQKIESLMSMGFPFETVVAALKESNNNVHSAVDTLFSQQRVGEISTATCINTGPPDNKLTQEIDNEPDNKHIEARYMDKHKPLSVVPSPQASGSKLEDDCNKPEQKPRRLKRLFSALGRRQRAKVSSVAKVSTNNSTFSSSSTSSIQDPPLKVGSITSRVREYERVVHSIATRALRRRCESCDKFLLSDETHVKSFTRYLSEQNGKVEGIFCQNCNAVCISGGADRLTVILSLLCHFDINSSLNTSNGDSTIKRWTLRSRPSRFKTGGGGIGYGGTYRERSPVKKLPFEFSQRFSPQKDDTLTYQTLTGLTALLPQTRLHDSSLDIQALLHYSLLLDKVTTMLRNNDLVDITSQAKLYLALIDFLQELVDHPSTSSLLSESRITRKSDINLIDIILGRKEKTSALSEPDLLQPLTQHIACLAGQCKTMLNSKGCDESDTRLYLRMVRLNDLLTANSKGNGKDKAVESAESCDWQNDLRVIDVPDENITINHQIPDAEPASSVRPSGQIKRIMQEIARLQASLPDGIFVRYASSRPDLIKILIIGPKDTPYENGIFEFDLFCDNSFPSLPPKMLLRTTGAGKVRFNPNLYNTGMVCLSLLGTWSGEPWTVKSTLLQILVSIQAMVFCEQPWYNEPGRETHRNDPLSDKYNTSLWSHVVQHGMIDWLERILPPSAKEEEKPEEDTKDAAKDAPKNTVNNIAQDIANDAGIWDEVIRKHFVSSRDQIAKTVTKWTLHFGRGAGPLKRYSNAGLNALDDDTLNQELVEYLRAALPTLQKAPRLSGC